MREAGVWVRRARELRLGNAKDAPTSGPKTDFCPLR